MEQAHFERQIQRLRSQWPNAYGEERTARIWLAFQRVQDAMFSRIVDRALDRSRTAPLVDDLGKLEQDVRAEIASNRPSGGNASLGSVLVHAAKANTTAVPD